MVVQIVSFLCSLSEPETQRKVTICTIHQIYVENNERKKLK